MTDQPTRIADLICDDDYELLADALGGLWTAAPSRRAEVHALAERTGIAPTVDYAGDDDD